MFERPLHSNPALRIVVEDNRFDPSSQTVTELPETKNGEGEVIERLEKVAESAAFEIETFEADDWPFKISRELCGND
jgi:hypothetical protein